jgi:protocatechuate 3,4-dioxygenase beta subunit
VALLALALAGAVFLATLSLQVEGGSVARPADALAAGTGGGKASSTAPLESSDSPAPGETAPEEPVSRTPATAMAAAADLVEVRGRLSMRDGSPPPADALVTLRTQLEEVDFPETVAALGGLARVAELRRREDLEERLQAVGGWKAKHRARTGEGGVFFFRVPPDHPKFHFEVEAAFAAYSGGEWFDLASPAVTRGITLTLEPAGKLSGTVRSASGEAVAGARLAMRPLVRGFLSFVRRGSPLEADARGLFSVGGLVPGKYEVAAIGAGCAPASRDDVEVRAGEEARVDLVLPVEAVAAGVVVDGSGSPVPEAVVRAAATERRTWGAVSQLPYGRARTAPDGSFRIVSLETGAHRITAAKPGFLDAEPVEMHVLPTGNARELRFVLEKGWSVAGRVVDAKGSPVEGALVAASPDYRARRKAGADDPPRWSRQEARTAVDGAFVLEGVGEGPLALQASLEGGGSASKEGLEAGSEEVEIVLSGASGVAGLVIEADTGLPVKRFSLSPSVEGGTELLPLGGGDGSRTFASAEGAFEIVGLSPGILDLSCAAEGFVPRLVEGIELKAGETHAGLEIRLRPGGTVRGVVHEREAGTPVAGATVEASALEASGDARALFQVEAQFPGDRPRASTDAEGRFEVTGVPPGRVRLRARHRDLIDDSSKGIEIHPREIVEGIGLSLSRGGGVDGFALDFGGVPRAGAMARAIAAEGGRTRSGRVDSTGYFLLEGLAPGPVLVEVTGPPSVEGGPPPVLRGLAEVEGGKVVRVEVRPPADSGCTLRGRVLRGGVGVEGATVTVNPAAGEAERRFPRPRANLRTARTAEGGAFEVQRLPSGRAGVTVRAPRGDSRSTVALGREIEIPEREECVIDFPLPSGMIAGRVVGAPDGRPVAGAEVRLEWTAAGGAADSWVSGSVEGNANADGRFAFADLPAGTYRVTASEGGDFWARNAAERGPEALAPAAQGPLDLRDGESAVVDFLLSRGAVAVATVVDPEGHPARDVMVRLVPVTEAPGAPTALRGMTTSTDRRGVARWAGIPPGRFRAVCEPSKYPRAESGEATLRVGEEKTFRIELREGTTAGVRVLDGDDRPIAAARVEFLDEGGRVSWAQARTWRFVGGAEVSAYLAPLVPGGYTIRVRAEGWKEESIPVRIGTDSPAEFVVRLRREEAEGSSGSR